MLGLPRAGHNPAPPKGDNAKTCARCHADVPLERAHWIARRDSGPSDSWNLVDLCPNCHTLLDNGDEDVVREVKEIVLLKAVRKLLEQSDELALRKELVDTCTAITMRQAKI
ncbi:MAG TPA: HNH endonuclease signature motif containing protein [Verrucomicrobiae bacterium]|nr:HNH endonuclease signature motif containing protein [Verrucomicrobiae bacterium]